MNNPATWSGIPYHFLEAGHRAGMIDEGLDLSVDSLGWKLLRFGWNAAMLLRGRRYGGFQYSDWFLQQLYGPLEGKLAGNRLINCFQMFPRSIVMNAAIEKWFYIDTTLKQLFASYGANIDSKTRSEILERERAGYQSAAGIVGHSLWAAKSVIHDYGIAAHKVQAIVPGANVDREEYANWDSGQQWIARPEDGRPVKLVFVGNISRRKGFDRFLEALVLACSQGGDFILRVIGSGQDLVPAPYRANKKIEWCGFLDKRTDARAFLHLVAEGDIGCLFSRAEAGGIVLREFHALGLAALGPDVGGAPEHMIPGASIPISVLATPADIADTLLGLCRNRQRIESMRSAAWQARHTALWDATVIQMRAFMSSLEEQTQSGQGGARC